MANEIVITNPTGRNLYAVVSNAIGQVYAGVTPETPATANWANYDIDLTEAGTTGIYRGNFPALSAGVYAWVVYHRTGANPAVTDAPVGVNGRYEWDGTAEVGLTTAISEPTSPPAASATLLQKLSWIFARHRNLEAQSPTLATVYRDNGLDAMGTATIDDSNNVTTRGKYT